MLVAYRIVLNSPMFEIYYQNHEAEGKIFEERVFAQNLRYGSSLAVVLRYPIGYFERHLDCSTLYAPSLSLLRC